MINTEKCLFARDRAYRITNRERKPPLKEDAVPGILSDIPEKKVRQAINAGTPVAVAKISVVSWALAGAHHGVSFHRFWRILSHVRVTVFFGGGALLWLGIITHNTI